MTRISYRDSRTGDQFDVMITFHTHDKMVHLVASLDGPTIVYINKLYEREGRRERGEKRARSSNKDKEGQFTSTRIKSCAVTKGIP